MKKNIDIKKILQLIQKLFLNFNKRRPEGEKIEQVKEKQDVVELKDKKDEKTEIKKVNIIKSVKFKKKYTITPRYLTPKTKKRSGQLISPAVKFIVAHDTGNEGSTASGNVRYYENNNNKSYPSAHIFVDDKEIIECIPALTSNKPEKAWHVLYDKPKDNKLFGYDANDAAIGVEYCFGGKINDNESYQKYIWVLAYICHKFKLDPSKSIAGHHILDPGRKIDPVNGLKKSGRTYDQLLKDVVNEYNECTPREKILTGSDEKLFGSIRGETDITPKLIFKNKFLWYFIVGTLLALIIITFLYFTIYK